MIVQIRKIASFIFGNTLCSFNLIPICSYFILVPPEPPVLHVIRTDTNSLHLKWTNNGSADTPILGIFLKSIISTIFLSTRTNYNLIRKDIVNS